MFLTFKRSLFYQEDGILLHVSCASYHHSLWYSISTKNTKSVYCAYKGSKNV